MKIKMKRLRIKKIQVSDITLYLYVLSIILTQSTMYGVLQNFQQRGIDSFSFRAGSLVIGFMFVIVLALSKGVKLSKDRINRLCLLFLYLAFYGLLNIVRIKAYLEGLFIPFFIACFISCFYSSKELLEKFFSTYCRIVLAMALISLGFYILGTTLHIISGTTMMYTNNGWWNSGTNYYYLSFINDWQTITIGGFTLVRNVGIFMEAPGYASILLYAFWWELMGTDKLNRWNIVILAITIFTTFSAKAYISSAIIIIMYLYSGQITLSKYWRKIRNVLLPILGCLVIFGTFQTLITRNIASNGGDSSLTIRMSDYLAAFKAWKDYPLFGCGFYNLNKLYSYYSSIRNSGTSTAGILNILAYGGIYMGIFYLTPFVKYIRHNIYGGNKYRIFSFTVLILFSLITGNEQYSYLMIFFMAVGYMLNTKNRIITLNKKNFRREYIE